MSKEIYSRKKNCLEKKESNPFLRSNRTQFQTLSSHIITGGMLSYLGESSFAQAGSWLLKKIQCALSRFGVNGWHWLLNLIIRKDCLCRPRSQLSLNRTTYGVIGSEQNTNSEKNGNIYSGKRLVDWNCEFFHDSLFKWWFYFLSF